MNMLKKTTYSLLCCVTLYSMPKLSGMEQESEDFSDLESKDLESKNLVDELLHANSVIDPAGLFCTQNTPGDASYDDSTILHSEDADSVSEDADIRNGCGKFCIKSSAGIVCHGHDNEENEAKEDDVNRSSASKEKEAEEREKQLNILEQIHLKCKLENKRKELLARASKCGYVTTDEKKAEDIKANERKIKKITNAKSLEELGLQEILIEQQESKKAAESAKNSIFARAKRAILPTMFLLGTGCLWVASTSTGLTPGGLTLAKTVGSFCIAPTVWRLFNKFYQKYLGEPEESKDKKEETKKDKK